jgi:hypothetical protein
MTTGDYQIWAEFGIVFVCFQTVSSLKIPSRKCRAGSMVPWVGMHIFLGIGVRCEPRGHAIPASHQKKAAPVSRSTWWDPIAPLKARSAKRQGIVINSGPGRWQAHLGSGEIHRRAAQPVQGLGGACPAAQGPGRTPPAVTTQKMTCLKSFNF